jgi:hypothetical protein
MSISGFLFYLFIVYLAYKNGMRAKMKEKSAGLYAVLTVVMFFVGYMVGSIFVIYFCRDLINFNRISDPAYMKEAQEILRQAFISNPLHPLTIELFGIGGYLLVRYILERIPVKKKNLPLWPDQEIQSDL